MTSEFPKRFIVELFSDRSRTTKLGLCLVSLFFALAMPAFTQGFTNEHEAHLNGGDPPGGLSYNDGDIFIGFRATDRTVDYLVNIYQPNRFANVSRGLTFQVSTGNLLPDLVTAFGPDWYTRIDPNTGTNAVLWAVFGGRQVIGSGDPANTLYSSNPNSIPWPRHSDTAQSFTSTLIASIGNTFANGLPTPNNPNGTIQNASGGFSFQTWNPTNEGVPNANLYFDRITPGAGPSTSLGYFTLNNSGKLSFHCLRAALN